MAQTRLKIPRSLSESHQNTHGTQAMLNATSPTTASSKSALSAARKHERFYSYKQAVFKAELPKHKQAASKHKSAALQMFERKQAAYKPKTNSEFSDLLCTTVRLQDIVHEQARTIDNLTRANAEQATQIQDINYFNARVVQPLMMKLLANGLMMQEQMKSQEDTIEKMQLCLSTVNRMLHRTKMNTIDTIDKSKLSAASKQEEKRHRDEKTEYNEPVYYLHCDDFASNDFANNNVDADDPFLHTDMLSTMLEMPAPF